MRSRDEMNKMLAYNADFEKSSIAKMVIEKIENSYHSNLSPVLSFRSNGSNQTNYSTASSSSSIDNHSSLDEALIYSSMSYQQILFSGNLNSKSSIDSQFISPQSYAINIADMSIEQIKSINKNQTLILNKELSYDKIRAIPTESVICSQNFTASVNGDDRYRVYCIPSSVKRIILESDSAHNTNGFLRSLKSRNSFPEIVGPNYKILCQASVNANVLILPLMNTNEIASISAATVTIDNSAVRESIIKAIPACVTKVIIEDMKLSAACYRNIKADTIELSGAISQNKIEAIPDCVKSIIFNTLPAHTIQKIVSGFQSRDCWPEIVHDKSVVSLSGTKLQSGMVNLYQSKVSENLKLKAEVLKLNTEIVELKKQIELLSQNYNKHSSSTNLESLQQQISEENSSFQILSTAKRPKHN